MNFLKRQNCSTHIEGPTNYLIDQEFFIGNYTLPSTCVSPTLNYFFLFTVPWNFPRECVSSSQERFDVLICTCQGCFLCARTAVKNWKVLWAECSLSYSCIIHSSIQQICIQHYSVRPSSKAPVHASFDPHSSTTGEYYLFFEYEETEAQSV